MKYVSTIIFILLSSNLFAQKHDYVWEIGQPPPTAAVLDFNYHNDSIYPINRTIGIGDANACISDKSGHLLFMTDGNAIADSTGNIMQNGDSLNLGAIRDWYPYGYPILQGNLFLPNPQDDSIYHLFHLWMDSTLEVEWFRVERLYQTTINKNSNNGKGAVIEKNKLILADSLAYGSLTACKHANGIDWWIIQPDKYAGGYYRFLLTRDSLYGPFYQKIGQSYTTNVDNQVCFSPDGLHYARYCPDYDLDVFDFDRCTGLLSNYQHIPIQDSIDNRWRGTSGVAFSPSSQFLYVSSVFMVYQFDMWAADLATSKDTVAIYDGFLHNNQPNQETYFLFPQLAPNGRIYINSARPYFHIIHAPDSSGAACRLQQHDLYIPSGFAGRGIPFMPHYRTPPLATSCDSTVLAVEEVVEEEEKKKDLVKVYPNPSSGLVNINWNFKNMKKSRKLIVYNSLGQEVAQQTIIDNYTNIDLSKLVDGIYSIHLVEDNQTVNTQSINIIK